jgi:23S rRNA pseudouridine2604 synthase
MNINRLLVKLLRISTNESIDIINNQLVYIDEFIATQKQLVTKLNMVTYNNLVIQDVKSLFYYAYYKPRGIESTQNLKIENNLAQAVNIDQKYFPLGRLDKDSEGLMILTNDGAIYKIVTSEKVEKEYIVSVDKILTEEALNELSSGIDILGKRTLPCTVKAIDDYNFKIILKQGLNRQIRRMCYKLGYNVIHLKRIRIGKVDLQDLKPNEKRVIQAEALLLN